MSEEIHIVRMTVTHAENHDGLPLLIDKCFGLVGTSPDFLYGIQGRTARHEFTSADLCLGDPETQTFATLTFGIPNDPKALLAADDEPTLRVFDCKKMRAPHRTALLDAFREILHCHHDRESIVAVIGDSPREEDVLHCLTAAYPEHLPELMRSTGLHIGIFMMRTHQGRIMPMAMIDRRLIQLFVTAIKSDYAGQAFSYRLADFKGNVQDIALPRRVRRSIGYEPTKDRYDRRVPTVHLVVVTKMCDGNSVELDVLCGGGVGPGEAWVTGSTDHREAPPELMQSTIATANLDHPFRTGVLTRTLLTLTIPNEVWPDTSTHNNLHKIRIFDPSMVSAKTLQALIDSINEIVDMYVYADRIRPVHKDPRKVFEALVLEYPAHVFDALEQTNIEVAVLPTRWKDGTLGLVTVVRKYCLDKYLRYIVTAGVVGPVRYVIDLDNDEVSPTWIDADRRSRQRCNRRSGSHSLTRTGSPAKEGFYRGSAAP